MEQEDRLMFLHKHGPLAHLPAAPDTSPSPPWLLIQFEAADGSCAGPANGSRGPASGGRPAQQKQSSEENTAAPIKK